MEDLSPLVTISGEVRRALELREPDLAAMADAGVVADFHCREGWSRLGVRWRGVPLGRLLERAEATAEGRFVTLAAGAFQVVLTREQAEDARVLLALERDGVKLDASTGLPRLVGPSDWDCFLSVKGVERIELTREPGESTAERIALERIGQ